MRTVISPAILCGGSGTRLWPLSTPSRPKQFLALTSSLPMITETSKRFEGSKAKNVAFGQTLVIGSEDHRNLLVSSLPTARHILEPFGRNSAPAVAALCLSCEPDELLLVLPADHNIQDVEAFHSAIEQAVDAAQGGAIITFGIKPEYPETGYGYIHAEDRSGPVRKVLNFVEKPPQDVAQSYLADGNYFWNAGIFLFKASTMLSALEQFAPDILPSVAAALGPFEDGIARLSRTEFAKVPDISIDYAVMEHADNVLTVPVDMGWSDVGDYQALHNLGASGEDRSIGIGPVELMDTSGIYARSEGPAIAVAGVKDLTIVATPDMVMVAPLGDTDAVKRLRTQTNINRDRLSVPASTAKRAKSYLWSAFDTWATKAWDEDRGGFVEQLSLDGVPDIDADRRVCVQARQIYSFARAVELDWPGAKRAKQLVEQGILHLNAHAKHPEGGWVHVLKADGTVQDPTRDLYDHAFLILAGAVANRATGNKDALVLAEQTLEFVETHLHDQEHGGWMEGISAGGPRRANPHMHMLEALLALYSVSKTPHVMELAREIVTLFETRFFNPATDCISEFFDQNWMPFEQYDAPIFEPGHHYEWASLLAYFERASGHDTLSWRRRVIRHADKYGRDEASQFAHNALQVNGEILNDKRRIWPQLEMLRARLLHPDTAIVGDAENLFERIDKTYLSWGPDGTWLDETDAEGTPISTAIPASILYHVVSAFSPLLSK